MLRRRLNPWLGLATVVAVGACGLNPQPDLPNNGDEGVSTSGGTSSSVDTGGTSSEPSPGSTPGGQTDSTGGKPIDSPEAGGAGGGDQAGAGGEGGSAGDGGNAGDSSAGATGQGGAGGAP